MFRMSLGAPVSRIKLPSIVSAFAFITIRLPTLLNGMIQLGESLVTTGSPMKLTGISLNNVSRREFDVRGDIAIYFDVFSLFFVANRIPNKIFTHINRGNKDILAAYDVKIRDISKKGLPAALRKDRKKKYTRCHG
jgi:hypothetical protein